MHGKCRLIRFSDDFVIIFEKKYDADRVMTVIPKRFGKYGLTVHPEKTKLVDFRAPHQKGCRHENQLRKGANKEEEKPETFDILGFTHFWCQTRRGGWVVQWKTIKSRLARGIRNIDQWCRNNRHKPIAEQWNKLCAKVRGHYAYYSITGNIRSITCFVREAGRAWHRWLNRRNAKNRMT